MGKPIIGITTRRYNHYTPTDRIQNVTIGCGKDYVDCVARSDGAPVLLPRIAQKDLVRAMGETIDGLLLSGGGDVLSLSFDEEPHLKNTFQDPIRDEMEFELVRVAMERNIPILGICRGIQILNVALGGTLVQDIPSEVPDALLHYAKSREICLVHTIDIETDSLLGEVLGTTSTPVSSWHHQAVKRLGKGLRINSCAKDGVIEGVESCEGKPILAVQCHPEDSAEKFPIFQRLFDWLVGKARERN